MFAAGSLVRGEGTAYSDLDLVVVYSALPCAYRESFTFERLPVEAFVHDPETLEYFSVEMDGASGIPALPHMVLEGREIPEPTGFSRMLKARAAALIDADPSLCTRYCRAFQSLFQDGEVAQVIQLTEELLAPHGGVLFDGYRSDAPPGWRTVLKQGEI